MSNKVHFSKTATRIAAGILAVAATAGTVSTVHARTDAESRRIIEASVDQELRSSSTRMGSRHGVATVAVAVDGQGAVRSIELVKSSDHSGFDREAFRIARRADYPAFGTPRIVAVVLGFNQQVDRNAEVKSAERVQAWLDDQRVLLAEKTTAQQPES